VRPRSEHGLPFANRQTGAGASDLARLSGRYAQTAEGNRVDHEDEEGAADPLWRAHAGCTGQSSSPRTARSERLSTEPESPMPGMPAM
jgi:hypothetical protein